MSYNIFQGGSALVLGTGYLKMPLGERMSLRYGMIYLVDDTGNRVELNRVQPDTLGKLFAIILEDEILHQKNRLRRLLKKLPLEVGEEAHLGTGLVFFEGNNQVGLRPRLSLKKGVGERNWLRQMVVNDLEGLMVRLEFREGK